MSTLFSPYTGLAASSHPASDFSKRSNKRIFLPYTRGLPRLRFACGTSQTGSNATEFFRSRETCKTDGIFALICSPEAKLSPRQMILHYSEKNKIEEAFRAMKGLLKLRPWFVYKESHVRAHYTICVLAYFIKKTIDQKLESANLKTSQGLSVARLLEELAATKITSLTLGQKFKKTTLSPTSASVHSYLKALKMEQLLKVPNSLE